MIRIVTKYLVTSLILWTNLDLSIGEGNNEAFKRINNETDFSINWDHETIVVVRWDIENPPIVEYDNLRFDIHFSVSDYIEAEKHVRYTIYQNAECGDKSDIITDSDGYMVTVLSEDDTPVGPGIDLDTKKTITISNQLVPQTITESKSYKEGKPGTGKDASISYCVRLSLWNGQDMSDPEADEINHLEVTIALNLDLTEENFSISGQEVKAKNKGVKTSDDQFFVEAFVCNSSGKYSDVGAPLQQGDTVRICIQPTKQAAEVGFRMQRIEKFNFIQGMTSQGAILNAEGSSNMLTNLLCTPGAKQCAFETLLFSDFFQRPEGTVYGRGEATLQWGGEGIDRRLQFYLDSLLAEMEYKEEEEYFIIEDDERILQERASTKSIQVPTFTILADDGRKRPHLLTISKSEVRTQQILLTSLLFIFCVILSLPLIYYYYYGTPALLSPDSYPIESDCESSNFDDIDRLTVFDDIDRWMMSIIPEDRTIVSLKSFLPSTTKEVGDGGSNDGDHI